MAEIVLGLGTSHSPLLSIPNGLWASYAERDKENRSLYRVPDGKHVNYEELLSEADPAVRKELAEDVFERRHEANQRGIAKVAEALAQADPDVLIMFGDDQSEIFDKEAMPPFCVFWQDEVSFAPRAGRNQESDRARVDYYGGDDARLYPVHAELGRHIVQSLNDQNFDTMHVRRMREGQNMSHAFGFVWRRLMSGKLVPTVPVHINTYFPPNQPTPERCWNFGKAIREAVLSWDSGTRVAVLGSGGFSHFVVDEEIDRHCLKLIEERNEQGVAALPTERLQAGTSEIRNWFAAAGAMGDDVEFDLFDYVPCYRSEAGTGCGMAFAKWS